jgi:hypothetical protein
MKFDILSRIRQAGRRVDLFSLQFRLTVGITVVSILGLSVVAFWTNWKIQQILIASHKQSVQDIAERFVEDVKVYSEMVSVQTGVQRAINNRSGPNLLIWVNRPDDTILAHSPALPESAGLIKKTSMALLSGQWIQPQVYKVNGHYLVVCRRPLAVNRITLGTLSVAQDITVDQTMLMAVVRTLRITSVLTILVIIVVIALYVRRSLQPLRQISLMTKAISAEDLGEARLELEHAPSEVKELADTFNMMLARLSEAWKQQRFSWEQQRQFVSNVSHELRTPLTIVHGYLQSTLRRGDNLTETQREALEIAASEADQTIRLLQDLLDLARADSGYMHFRLEPLLLNDLVAEVVGMAEQFSRRSVVIEATAFAIEVNADRNRLKQVLLNLVDNAVKYSDLGEPVTVKLDQRGKQVTIQVCDRGGGIPLQQQSRIFERFYRVDEARARSTGGSGLGLSIVQTLVEGMNGSITVRSHLGQGSIFTVTLPAHAAKS